MSTFKFSAAVNADKVFLIQKSAIDGRIDPQFYSELPELTGFVKLLTVASVTGGKRLPPMANYASETTDFLYLRVTDVNKDGDIDFSKIRYLEQDTFEFLKRYEVANNELIISIAGTIGRICLVKGIHDSQRAILTENCAKISIKPNAVTASYLGLLLNLPIVQKQIELSYIQTTIPKLGLERIKNLYLPPIPPSHAQQQIIDIFAQFQKNSKEKHQQAAALLASIEGYLLGELGITLPEQDNRLEKRMFYVNSREVTGGRFDPDYRKIEYKSLLHSIQQSRFKTVLLKDISEKVHSGKTPASYEYTDDKTNFPLIKVGSYSRDFVDLNKVDYATKTQPHQIKKGDIFILSAAHQAEYVGRHIKYLVDEPVIRTSFVGELICVRVNERCNSIFLFSLLSTDLFKTLINREKTGQTSHVYGRDLRNLPVPLPPLLKQQEIAQKIESIRTQAQTLQQHAEQILADAKAQIERMILGGD
jgi:restriction endonuclease S subunit